MLERVAAIAESNGYNLKAPLILSQEHESETNNINNGYSNEIKQPPARPAPPNLEPVRPAPEVMHFIHLKC